MSDFRVGQKVRCIDIGQRGEGNPELKQLVIGKIYTIKKFYGPIIKARVFLAGVNGMFFPDRFAPILTLQELKALCEQ